MRPIGTIVTSLLVAATLSSCSADTDETPEQDTTTDDTDADEETADGDEDTDD